MPNLSDLRIRRAEMRDMKAVFDLSNDPVVRASSIRREPIPWESHMAWFAKALADPCLKFFVAETADGAFVGQVRFALVDGEWVVSVSVASAYRGQGLADEILRRGLDQAGLERATAFIYDTNRASLRAFEKAGFRNSHLLKYVYDKNATATDDRFEGKGDGKVRI